jgi:hypothetical protein
MLLTPLFICLVFFRSRRVCAFRVCLMFLSSNTCLIIVTAFVTLFQSFAQNLRLFHCRVDREIASGRMNDSKQEGIKISNPTWICGTLRTNSQDMIVPPHKVTSPYYNCCTYGSTSPGNYGRLLADLCPATMLNLQVIPSES